MPKYTYRCDACDLVFCERHSSTEKLEICKNCSVAGNLTRLPANFRLIKEQPVEENRPGALVDQSIGEFKQDLANEKQKLKNNMWGDD